MSSCAPVSSSVKHIVVSHGLKATFGIFCDSHVVPSGVAISQHSGTVCDVLSLYPQAKIINMCKFWYYGKHAKNLWHSEI